MPDSETIPDLLDRLEREHTRKDASTVYRVPMPDYCGVCSRPYPCEIARVVAHARGLQRAFDVRGGAMDLRALHRHRFEHARQGKRKSPDL